MLKAQDNKKAQFYQLQNYLQPRVALVISVSTQCQDNKRQKC